MKQKSILFVLIFFISFLSAYSQTDTTLKKLLLLNYSAFKGHTVDSLFKKLPSGSVKTRILPSHRGDYGDVLVISYPNSVNVWLQVKTFKYMNPWINKTNPNLPALVNWDVNLFKKETLAFAIVYQNTTCWAGCENDPKSQWERKIKH